MKKCHENAYSSALSCLGFAVRSRPGTLQSDIQHHLAGENSAERYVTNIWELTAVDSIGYVSLSLFLYSRGTLIFADRTPPMYARIGMLDTATDLDS